MENKKGFGESLEAFFAGKGFYIVLFLCVAVIGVSAWVMLAGEGTVVEEKSGLDMSVSVANEMPEDIPVMKPQTTPASVMEEAPEQSVIEPEPDFVETSVMEEPETFTETAKPENAAPVSDFFVWPVSGEIENPYSVTALIYSRTMRDWRTHEGIDIAAAMGTQVKAATGGIVTEVYDDELYGMTVVIDHGNGLSSRYSNLADIPTVAVGDAVDVGAVIGSIGDTALCETGEVTHLHFEMIKDGTSVDPTEYMP